MPERQRHPNSWRRLSGVSHFHLSKYAFLSHDFFFAENFLLTVNCDVHSNASYRTPIYICAYSSRLAKIIFFLTFVTIAYAVRRVL